MDGTEEIQTPPQLWRLRYVEHASESPKSMSHISSSNALSSDVMSFSHVPEFDAFDEPVIPDRTVLGLDVLKRQPPATAGMMLTVSPSGTGVSRPCK